MTRQQTKDRHDLDAMLDELIDIDVACSISNFNRARKKQDRRQRPAEDDSQATGFEKWVDERKGGRKRRTTRR